MTRLKAEIIVITFVLTGFAAAQLPENPVADKKFVMVTFANAAATIGDIATTSILVGHTASCPYEVWSADLYGRKPSLGRTSIVMGGLMIASAGVSYELKKHKTRIWKLPLWVAPQGYLAYGHASGTIHNLRTCH